MMPAHEKPRASIIPQHEECEHCLDLGVVRVFDLADGFETLMLCDCPESQRQTYEMARWDRSCERIFRRERCPVAWFKPAKHEVGNVIDIKSDAVDQAIMYWKTKVRIAEGYWEQARRQVST